MNKVTKLVNEFYFFSVVCTVIVWACGQAERKSEFREACGVCICWRRMVSVKMNKVQGPTTFIEMWSVRACGQVEPN